MAKKQTRRAISVSRGIYERIREEAERDGLTMSHWMTVIAKAELDKRGRPFNVQLSHVPRETANRIARTKAAQAARS